MTKINNFLISHNHNRGYKETKYRIEPNISYIRLIWINTTRNTNIIKILYVVVKRYLMVIKYVVREYMLRLSSYEVRLTKYVLRGYTLRVIWYILYFTCHVGMCYAVRAMWISLYDSPPLASFQGLFSFRKWFCFLDLKIKNDWSFHFRYSKFSGKGNKGKYL